MKLTHYIAIIIFSVSSVCYAAPRIIDPNAKAKIVEDPNRSANIGEKVEWIEIDSTDPTFKSGFVIGASKFAAFKDNAIMGQRTRPNWNRLRAAKDKEFLGMTYKNGSEDSLHFDMIDARGNTRWTSDHVVTGDVYPAPDGTYAIGYESGSGLTLYKQAGGPSILDISSGTLILYSHHDFSDDGKYFVVTANEESGRGQRKVSSILVSLYSNTGTLIWMNRIETQDSPMGDPIPSPGVADVIISRSGQYVGVAIFKNQDTGHGYEAALHVFARDGHLLWSKRLEPNGFKIRFSPSETSMYCVNLQSKNVRSFDVRSGSINWDLSGTGIQGKYISPIVSQSDAFILVASELNQDRTEFQTEYVYIIESSGHIKRSIEFPSKTILHNKQYPFEPSLAVSPALSEIAVGTSEGLIRYRIQD